MLKEKQEEEEDDVCVCVETAQKKVAVFFY